MIKRLPIFSSSPVKLWYMNYKGEISRRTITAIQLVHEVNEYHSKDGEPRWILKAFDHDKNAERSFAFHDFLEDNDPKVLEILNKG